MSTAVQIHYYELEQVHSKEHAKIVAQSHRKAIDKIEAIASKENIDCDFERLDSYLFPLILTRLVKSGDQF